MRASKQLVLEFKTGHIGQGWQHDVHRQILGCEPSSEVGIIVDVQVNFLAINNLSELAGLVLKKLAQGLHNNDGLGKLGVFILKEVLSFSDETIHKEDVLAAERCLNDRQG